MELLENVHFTIVALHHDDCYIISLKIKVETLSWACAITYRGIVVDVSLHLCVVIELKVFLYFPYP